MAKLKSGFRGERAIIIPPPIVEDFKNDILGKLLYISDIGFYPTAEYHYRRRSKDQALQYIFIYCVKAADGSKVAMCVKK